MAMMMVVMTHGSGMVVPLRAGVGGAEAGGGAGQVAGGRKGQVDPPLVSRAEVTPPQRHQPGGLPREGEGTAVIKGRVGEGGEAVQGAEEGGYPTAPTIAGLC
jgi:hypothetical protein